jgi:hypothetical protein
MTAAPGISTATSARPKAIQSLSTRAELGRAARAAVPRGVHGDWIGPSRRADPIGILEEQARNRVEELVPIRYGRMLSSPFAFYRGAAAVMAADLAGSPVSGLRVQACGDAHASNFGIFATPERGMVFDVNDFDETLPGPWEWDLKRLVASLAIAARYRGVDDKRRAEIVSGAVRSYRAPGAVRRGLCRPERVGPRRSGPGGSRGAGHGPARDLGVGPEIPDGSRVNS